MSSPFFALISRVRFIYRWGLMHNVHKENVQEHSHMAAVIAHALAAIGKDIFGRDIDPGAAAAAALYHDVSEIFTGDMPTPVKYRDERLTGAYKDIEDVFAGKLLNMLPEEMKNAYRPLMFPQGDIKLFVKAADTLCAYIKCVEELKSGNNEFKSAMAQIKSKLDKIDLPELRYFMEHFMGAFSMTLDELND